jgi:TPR repeat protein
MSPHLANMAFVSDSMAIFPVPSTSGHPAGWLMASDIVMAAFVPVCVMMILVGMVYLWGVLASGQELSPVDQFAMWRKAAKKGDSDAEFNLGVCYSSGEGVPKDVEEAVNCYRKAAEQGYAVAQYNLGLSCYHGEGVPQDLGEAASWFYEAAGQGLPDASHSLGVCHANGLGVAKNKAEAAKWYRVAAEQGHAKAQFNLGLCHAGGHGVPKDNLLAYMWWNVSAASGLSEAAKKRDALARRMAKEDVTEAQRLCRNWLRQEPEAVVETSEPLFPAAVMAAA